MKTVNPEQLFPVIPGKELSHRISAVVRDSVHWADCSPEMRKGHFLALYDWLMSEDEAE